MTRTTLSVPPLMNIEQAATYLKEHGVPRVSAPTLRKWRGTWPDGQRKGPPPLLLDARCLRYAKSDCDQFIAQYLDEARRRAIQGEATA